MGILGSAINTGSAPWDMQKWSWVKYCKGSAQAVPDSSGVYILMKVRRIFGLPANIEIIYVGRSVNLRRRYQEHLHLYEPNSALSRLADREDEIEFWFLELSRASIASIEKELISSLKPRANHIGINTHISA